MTSMPIPPAARAEAERRLAFLRRLALLCAVLVLTITSLSAFIRLSRAGLSCEEPPAHAGLPAAVPSAGRGQSAGIDVLQPQPVRWQAAGPSAGTSQSAGMGVQQPQPVRLQAAGPSAGTRQSAGMGVQQPQPVRLQAAGPSAGTRQSAGTAPVQPRCYGQGLRELQQGLPTQAGEGAATAAARLVHRIVASAALLLVLTMVVVCLTARPVLWPEARVALALLALALFLAVLGRWSSDARVPAVAMGNLLGGFAMLALCWRLARGGSAAAPWLRTWAGFGVAWLACQVALGGLLSASFAAASCDGLADCLARAAGVPWSALDPWREPVLAAAPPVNPSGALVQAAHRLSAIAVLLVLLPLGVVAFRHGRRGPALLLLALLAAALALGLLMTGGAASLALALAHNIVAALLLATAFELTRGAGATGGP